MLSLWTRPSNRQFKRNLIVSRVGRSSTNVLSSQSSLPSLFIVSCIHASTRRLQLIIETALVGVDTGDYGLSPCSLSLVSLSAVPTSDVDLFGRRREGNAERAEEGPAISIWRRRRRPLKSKRNFSRQVTQKWKGRDDEQEFKDQGRRQKAKWEISLGSQTLKFITIPRIRFIHSRETSDGWRFHGSDHQRCPIDMGYPMISLSCHSYRLRRRDGCQWRLRRSRPSKATRPLRPDVAKD